MLSDPAIATYSQLQVFLAALFGVAFGIAARSLASMRLFRKGNRPGWSLRWVAAVLMLLQTGLAVLVIWVAGTQLATAIRSQDFVAAAITARLGITYALSLLAFVIITSLFAYQAQQERKTQSSSR